MSKPYNIMIMSASSGSGHTRAGEAIMKACEKRSDEIHATHVDTLAYTNRLFRDFYATGYIEAVKKTPHLWGAWYEESDTPWKTDKLRYAFERINTQPMVDLIRKESPDVIVCTHFLPSDIISHLITKKEYSSKMTIVVTDFYVHAMWLCKYFHRYFLASNECKRHMEILGFASDKLSVTGIPIDPVFSEPKDIPTLRRKFQLDESTPVILISAGTFGITSAEDITQALNHLTHPAQLVIICGKDEELKARMEKVAEENKNYQLRYHVVGYTNEMHDYMAASDLFIGKPGGLTTCECLSQGLPMVVFHPIPGQEEHNSDFLLENGVAVKPASVYTLSYKVNELLRNPERLKQMADNAKALACPDAAEQIVDILLQNRSDHIQFVKQDTPM